MYLNAYDIHDPATRLRNEEDYRKNHIPGVPRSRQAQGHTGYEQWAYKYIKQDRANAPQATGTLPRAVILNKQGQGAPTYQGLFGMPEVSDGAYGYEVLEPPITGLGGKLKKQMAAALAALAARPPDTVTQTVNQNVAVQASSPGATQGPSQAAAVAAPPPPALPYQAYYPQYAARPVAPQPSSPSAAPAPQYSDGGVDSSAYYPNYGAQAAALQMPNVPPTSAATTQASMFSGDLSKWIVPILAATVAAAIPILLISKGHAAAPRRRAPSHPNTSYSRASKRRK